MKFLYLSIIIVSLGLFSFTQFSKVEASDITHLVPQWIKHDALWWSQGTISDDDFINCMKWLVENRILPVNYFVKELDSQSVPNSVKKIAYAWSQNEISDSDFLGGVEYMIRNGIMKLNDSFVSQITKERFDQVSVQNDTKKAVVIIPVFTALAYSKNAFYAYYDGSCNSSCLTLAINSQIPLGYSESVKAVDTLQSLGYYTVTDIDVDKNPQILSQYDKVIVLHNEYVTQNEFAAITTHPHVIYLYPNSLYAQVYADYDKNTLTLARGHGYPDLQLRNGFDWKYDNSQFEYDTSCQNWKFDKIDNGIMLDCYPENHLANNLILLKTIKDY